MQKLLVIDDDEDRAEQVRDWFKPLGYEVFEAYSGSEGIEKAKEIHPDLVILDIFMDEMDGHEVLTRLRRDASTAIIPIVFFTHKGEEDAQLVDVIHRGMNENADYIIVKKWGMLALQPVVERLLRKKIATSRISVEDHELILAEGCYEIWLDEEQRHLTGLESRVLDFLREMDGSPSSVQEISRGAWPDPDDELDDGERVRRVISRLRKKTEPVPSNPIFVVTVPGGFGYKLASSEK